MNENAIKLANLLKEHADKGEVSDLIVIYSRPNEPQTVVVGYTGQTPTLWTLGALDYARWHTYSLMDLNRVAGDMALAGAVEESEFLKQRGYKPN